jgi:formiminotetrahydrofolate cyclodeaminase
MGPSAERTELRELLVDLAARTPAPAGGCATAWAGALAAALAEMVARFAEDSGALARATAYRGELLAAGEEELSSYEPVLQAWRLPAGDPSRQQRLSAALSDASEAPLSIARASAGVAELASEMAARSKPAVASDAITAVLLAEGSSRAAARIVEMNLSDQEGDPRLAAVKELLERAGAARAGVLASSSA